MSPAAPPFFENPILNSPYEEPKRHHALDPDGQPLNEPPRDGRRRSEFITPVPRPRKKKQRVDKAQGKLGLEAGDDISTDQQEYNPTPIINEIRGHLAQWRALPQSSWGVSPATARLLHHWRNHPFQGVKPFYCQIEAVETVIWLTEVAKSRKQYATIWEHLLGANEQANPELLRLAMKMATGAGKTTVMAMLIAWQTVNAVRSPTSTTFSRGFLVIAPGITIKDRLRVLLPSDLESYYRARELVPGDMLDDIGRAKIVITNYHALQLREVLEVNKVGRSLLQGRHEPILTKETEGQMVRRVAEELMGLKNIVVINDEAHHCYREKPGNDDLEDLKGDDKKEAQSENDAARLWISGIESFKRKLGVRAVYDLSATPFFLRGSGYAEGTLFPWTVSDFSLMDAIECGIVKLPRVPVADNIPEAEVPIFRELWEHIRDEMPKKGRGKGQGDLDPQSLPAKLQTALVALYNHYEETFDRWRKSGIDTPPVFIVVCNNTSASKLVYEWLSGWQRPVAEDSQELRTVHHGNLRLFSNFDEHGNRLARPNTLLIDSKQLESGEALDDDFRRAAALEIEQYKREIAQRSGSGEVGELSDSDLLREVMNTVGKKGRLGEQVRCVVSVSMLTEGWDANTVTHILGVRAFGTQLLCEQVVGRGLRRYSYDLNSEQLFDVEYADIMGIPFDFTAKPQVAAVKPPKKLTRVAAVKERAALEIVFPRVVGYRIDLPEEKLEARFTPNAKLVLTPDMVGPGQTLLEGIVGEGVTLTVAEMKDKRPSTVSYELAKYMLYSYFKDADGEPKLHLFYQIQRIVRRWIDEGYLECKGGTGTWMLQILSIASQAAERIYNGIAAAIGDEERIRAVLDPYNPKGSTRHVGFMTSKDLYATDPKKCHINYVVCDSEWEAELARAAEAHPRVVAYVKNQGLGLEVPYKDGTTARFYIPDFVVLIDDGKGPDDLLRLVVEVKGYRRENVKLKSETMNQKWVRGVNNLGSYGRWAFEEFNDVFEMQKEFGALIDRAVEKNGTELVKEVSGA
ncbi:BPTD_3080 family restriction endonuclease [Sinorhizobium meliloti]|uniref:BPTD_3080 family restriction endonuclease n=1 Tax=Rhizobium meliloti TaxID=382 RepID=UPI0002FF9515|nr:DEAD/DEAH box helicase family protein [Sinorhizobium meliloti]MDE3767564.1 DEAD/DEAH box helicase family protein [Sinorhizobium meliloti]MDE3779806.1 DEAD/DEAH box helicase family protein [Sinorhizobium meliloti]MDE3807431.1 DEAD/DEAH box helicase family protein [Sinorhizobium meliloti]